MHEDATQDMDMIKSVLQKIVDEMGSLEADRIMPESRKPKMVKVETEVVKPVEAEMSEESDDLDPAVLDQLLVKADEADEMGELPEDKENDLPPEIADAVRRRKETK